MDDCLICYESPCECLNDNAVKKATARASRRSTAEPVQPIRKGVPKFSSAPLRVPAKTEEPLDTGPASEEDDEVLLAAILCFAPLMSDSELSRHTGVKRPPSLLERRAKFLSEVGEWSEARYG